MHAYVVADPDAMVIEIVGTPITPLAVLCVLEYVRIAHIAKELVIACIKIKLGEPVLFCSSGEPFKSHSRVSRITFCHLCCQNDHHEESKEVKARYYT